MRCSHCGNEVLVQASFCPSCGTRLEGQPATPPDDTSALSLLNASDIVLMFADRFAQLREEGYKVPCSQVEVSVSSLVIATATAALASLANTQLIGLSRGQKKGLLFKREAALIKRLQGPAEPILGLEGKIMASLTGDEQRDSVGAVVRRLLGNSTMDPYTVILSQVMEHAHQAGFFVEDEKAPPIVKFLAGKTVATPLSPLCERIAAAAGEVAKVQELLDRFKAADAALYDLIGKDVKKSIESAYIQT